jgi:cyclase
MVDELIYLNINRDDNPKQKNDFFKIIKDLSTKAFMPITVGGKIKNLNDIEKLLSIGADKITINSASFNNRKLIINSAKEFGSQCIVVSIDVKKINKDYFVFINNGKTNTNLKLEEWVKICQSEGAGEILLNSIDRDGSKEGYDFEILNKIKKIINIPLIFCGGAGKWDDFRKCLIRKEVDAAAGANIQQMSARTRAKTTDKI